MRKFMFLATMVTVFVSFTAMAFAEISFEFRVPAQVTGKKPLKDVSGNATLLLFALDDDTKVGILNESIDFSDSTSTTTPHGSYNVTAIRVSKAIAGKPFRVGVDIGNLNIVGGETKSMADIFGSVNLLSSKAKTASYMDFEVLYRFAKATSGNIKDFSGTMINIVAGITF